MSRGPGRIVIRLLAPVHALATGLLPRRTRREYLADLEITFRDTVADAARRGSLAATRAGLAEIADVVWTAVRLRLGRGPSATAPVRRSRSRASRWTDGLRLDFVQAARRLRAIDSMMAVATLAAGTGAVLTVFALFDAALLKPLPYPEPDRLVQIGTLRPGRTALNTFSAGLLADVRERTTAFAMIGAGARWNFALTGGGSPERVQGAYASEELLPLLGARTVVGRPFTVDDHGTASDATVVLGHGLWVRRWAGDPAVVGHTVHIDGRPHTVIGVLDADFLPPEGARLDGADLWIPMVHFEGGLESNIFVFDVVARLRDETSEALAREQLAAIGPELIEVHRMSRRLEGIDLAPLQRVTAGDARTTLYLLLWASLALLVMVCANAGGVLLARHERRGRELGVRRAIGASRGRIVRLQLLEGVAVGTVGTALGLPICFLLLRWLTRAEGLDLPRMAEAVPDLRLLAGATLVATLVGAGIALAPVARWLRVDLRGSIESSRTRLGRPSLQSMLLMAQVALTFALAVGAGVLVRSLIQMSRVDPGFRTESVLTLGIGQGTALESPPPDERRAYFAAALDRLRAIPGVSGAHLFAGAPSRDTGWSTYVRLESRPEDESQDSVGRRIVDPGALESLGMRIVGGRGFAHTDDADGVPVVLVSEGLARAAWDGRDPVGSRLQVGGFDPDVWWTVVGVVADARFAGPRRQTPLQVYLSALQEPPAESDVVIRYAGDLETILPAVREAIWAVDPAVPITSVATLRELLAHHLDEPNLFAGLLSAFAGLALALAALGLYASVAAAVARRRREIALRVALGAAPSTVTRLVLGQGMAASVAGLAVGAVAAGLGSRLLEAHAFGVSASDPATFVAVGALVLATSALACWIPGRAAARSDPATALRDE